MLLLRIYWEYNLWLLIVSILLFFFLFSVLYLFTIDISRITFSIKIFLNYSYDFSVCIFMDYTSLIFSIVVCFITFNVVFFSKYYIKVNHKVGYFILLMILFVVSMLLLINVSDIFILILGWDGLGIISFLLVVYYIDNKSIFSGLVTLLVNRLGDCFLIITIVLLSYSLPFSFRFTNTFFSMRSFIIVFFLILGTITKSAIFPFSSWLPAAIAAPTPISALVHSSTLVTAGLYLIIRFSNIITLCSSFSTSLVFLGLYTSLYAGLNALVEKDLKKLVALSTLSHLGFICSAIFLGSSYLAFFHLLSHALFKRLLFICVGEIILLHSHSQDSRYITSHYSQGVSSSFLLIFSLYNLLGLPFMRGFYSKDYILEMSSYSSFSFFILLILYLNVILTFCYSLNIYKSVLSYSNSFTIFISSSRSIFPTSVVVRLAITSTICSSVILWLLPFSSLLFAPSFLKLLPFIILIFTLFLFILVGYSVPVLPINSFSSMLYLSFITSTFTSRLYTSISFKFYKGLEAGVLDNLINVVPVKYIRSLSNFFFIFINNINIISFMYLFIILLYFII